MISWFFMMVLFTPWNNSTFCSPLVEKSWSPIRACLGPWAVRNVPASRASEWSNYQTYGIYWDFTNKNTGNGMGICMFFYSKMTLLSIQATEMPFQWIHSMDRCERGHGGHKKASGVPNIWRRLEHCMDPQSLCTYVIVSLSVFIMHIYILKRINEKL